MDFFDAAILGIVEGLTEFLPISSTGHLILTSHLLGLGDSESVKAFEVIIQSGAIFAVIWEYRNLLAKTCGGLKRCEAQSMHLFYLILFAFLPAAILGVLVSKHVKAHLFGIFPVACALIVGGIVMILVERFSKKATSEKSFDQMTKKDALMIGIAQCFSLWPGTSRSMATILGGRFIGLTNKTAAEFSFLLAIPTIIGASVYDLYKSRSNLSVDEMNIGILWVGLIFSFVTALIVIRAFLKFLSSHSLEAFGWYRILVGLVFLFLLA
ncbi:MAG: undecaprenyl-diphosphate phosphatase [Deltaproteobacteria bacterium]|nr:undecaprenyl-diphosphate phosphatase [Deltaproteobacteria bacterium]